jgi:hypothetical protein
MMRRRTAWPLVLAATATTLTSMTVPGAAGAPQPPAAVPGEAAGRTVTLVTGDRVHLVAGRGTSQSVRVERGPGRKGITFVRRMKGRELTIIPSDAAPLVMAGRLDPTLFNVTTSTTTRTARTFR